jgi:uncharacterized protein (TIGR00251 family)
LPEDKNNDYLYLKVTPNAARSEITGETDGVLYVKVAAPPVKGKANRELIVLLSQVLGVKKSAIAIVKGQTSRNKVVTIEGLKRNEIIDRLST